MSKIRLVLSFILAVLLLVASPRVFGAARLANAEGNSRVTIAGSESSASQNVEADLPPGTIIRTGPNGRVMVEIAPGSMVEVEPNSEVIIGDATAFRGQPGTGAAPGTTALPDFDISRYFPPGVTANDITPEQYAEAVYQAVLENPDQAAEIAAASFQSVIAAGRYTERGGKQDVDPDGTRSDPSPQEWSDAISNAAKRGAPQFASQIDTAMTSVVSQPTIILNQGSVVAVIPPGGPEVAVITPGGVETVGPGQTLVTVPGSSVVPVVPVVPQPPGSENIPPPNLPNLPTPTPTPTPTPLPSPSPRPPSP